MKVVAILAAAAAALGGSALAQTCDPSPETHRRIVLEFYQQALVGLQPRAGFERFVAPEFVEHKPDIETGTRDGAVAFLEALIKETPSPSWKVLRTVAEGDLVFLHASFTPAAGAAPYAGADLFRLKDCKIVEHWDVVGAPVRASRNPHGRF